MSCKQNSKAPVSNESDVEDGKMHLTTCNGTGDDGNPSQCGPKTGFRRKF